MSINLGIGMLEVAIGTLVDEKAKEMGLGTVLPRYRKNFGFYRCLKKGSVPLCG